MIFGWGETMAEARKYISLNKYWKIVEDSEVIRSFIEEKRREECPSNLSGWLLKQWKDYDSDIDRLETQLASA
jgi:hypothetical protein